MDGNSLGTAAVVAVFLLPVVSLIKRPTWSAQAKQLLAMAAAFVAAIIGAVVDGHVNSINEFIPLLSTSFATSQLLYTQYFQSTDINTKLSKK